MKKYGVIIASLLLMALLMAGCAGLPGGTSPGGTGYLRFLLSDDDSEVTAIDDFESVIITVNKIGFQRGGESGNWTESDVSWTGDLLGLIGTNASVIWDGYIEAGFYTKAFIYVSNVTGNLTEEAGGGQADIWVPSDKFQITMPEIPFEVTKGGAIVDFVFDVTVVKAGESGQYLIMPQVAESGPDQDYRIVDEDDSDGEIELKGNILAIGDDICIVSVGNEEWSVNVTEAEISGTPAIGLKAKIEGTIGEDNIILASEVKVEEGE
ncbi:MAG: DUF4382 domain-containing protein [Chloroflexota bacterium]|nr:DUF4382 domain-containing protein [Chloroflexota bacterium]